MTELFAYDPAITDRFPSIRAGVVSASGLSNGPSPEELAEKYRAEQADAIEGLATTPISETPSVKAWRQTFSAFGVKPTQYRSAVEALLRRLDKSGDIPAINTLVDIGNLISIRYAVPVAVLDQASLVVPITVRFATGTERFIDLGSGEEQHPEPGEVIFVDEADHVCARRWCWRQSAASATGAETTAAIFTIEALHQDAAKDVASATDDLVSLLNLHLPRTQTSAHLLPA